VSLVYHISYPATVDPFLSPPFFSPVARLFSINSRLVTPDASRTSTPVEDVEIFDPSRPSMNPGDSVLLPAGKVPGYLDIALKALSLNTEVRTSFITYVYLLTPLTYPMKPH
jgi:hypothetical protein